MTKTAKLPCYHVHTALGHVYGVAATGKRDALQMTQDRLTREHAEAVPVAAQFGLSAPTLDKPYRAMRVGTWDADYGTVLWYS